MRTRQLFLLAALAVCLAIPLQGQKVLQIERANSPRTQKIGVGAVLTFRLHGDPNWYTGEIANLLPEDSIIVFHNRFVKSSQVAAFRYELGWARGVGRQLFWFGLGWSGFALVGTATDGIPESHYRWSDATVTGAAVASSWLLPRVFAHKTTRFGRNRRIRLLDLSPE
ncbi:MAG: hypothetical protein ACKOA4_01745 [Haliscomenobacter sp.]